jgi:two-component system, NtrC family, response regulator AtoC
MACLHVLVIDDDAAARQTLAGVVRHAGHSVVEAGLAAEATAKLAQGGIDVALCDINLPDGNGIDLIRNSRSAGLGTAFIVLTAVGAMEAAAEAVRAGAWDRVAKPVNSEEVLHRLAQADALRALREENRALRRLMDEHSRTCRATVPCMRDMAQQLGEAAPADSAVPITGESGTRKGIAARRSGETGNGSGNGGEASGMSVTNGHGLRSLLRRVEAEIVRRAIEEAAGDRRSAAQRLGIGLSSLYRKLEEFERLGL